MYKVFFNQKPLILTNEIQEFSDTEPFIFIKYSSARQILKALKSTKNSKVYLYHKNIDKLWKTFLKQFPVIEAAGGLVERTDNKFLFIFRNDKWDLPKGGVEKNELIIEAAKREVMEETGVGDLIVQNQLSVPYHIFKKVKDIDLRKPIGLKCQLIIWDNLDIKLKKEFQKLNGYQKQELKAF